MTGTSPNSTAAPEPTNPTYAQCESAAREQPMVVGEVRERYAHDDHRRIFLDLDHVRKWDTGVFQYFPQPEKIVLTGLESGGPGSWDARLNTIYGSVLIEGGRWRMWCGCMPDALSYDENADHFLACYFESDDGLRWRKPDLRLTGQRRWPGNNLLPLPGVPMGVVPALSGAGYKYLAATVQIAPHEPDVTDACGFTYSGPGTYLWASDDGLRWRQLTLKPPIAHGDTACLFADHATGRYFLYQKTGMLHGLHMRRSWLGLESTDGVHWEGYEGLATWRECFKPDDADDLIALQRGQLIADYYAISLRRVGDLYVAGQTLFTMGSPLRMSFGQSPNGLCHTRLAYSHNGFNWHHPKGRPAWLELGRPGEPDAGFHVGASAWVDHGDFMDLYYTGSHMQHGCGINPDFSLDQSMALEEQRDMGRIMLARQKRDRFASLGAPYRGVIEVENTTRMERTSGRRHMHAGPRGGEGLYVNALTRNGGTVRAAIHRHYAEEPLPGFSFEDCVPFAGDAVRAPIRFKGATVAQVPEDMGLSLRFELRRAELFGFEWGEKTPD